MRSLWTKTSASVNFVGFSLYGLVFSCLLRQCQSSFVLSSTPRISTRTSQIHHRHHHKHQEHHHFHTFPPNVGQSVRRHGRITVLSSQQQNTIEEKEKSATTKTKRRTWEESFQLLVSYNEKHGNCNVPYRYKEDSRLGNWVHSQRSRKDRLSDECIAKLDDLGFSWSNEINEEQWEEMFERLVLYAKENNGDCNVPRTNDNDVNKKLCKWVTDQRLRKLLLSKERRTRLDNLGLIWENSNKLKADHKWNEQYQRLKEYKQNYGHCRVPIRWKDDRSLGLWVNNQRQQYRKGQLREDRISKLDEIDFTWKVRDGNQPNYVELDFNWFVKFGKLLAFHEEYGHCDVPQLYKRGKSLGEWVDTQRMNQKNGTLRGNRKERLDDIGFTWNFDDQKDEQWKEKYQELKRFKEQNGHLRLSVGSLKDWVDRQRVQFAAGKVPHERKDLLDKLDFRWEIQTRSI